MRLLLPELNFLRMFLETLAVIAIVVALIYIISPFLSPSKLDLAGAHVLVSENSLIVTKKDLYSSVRNHIVVFCT